MGLLAEPVFAKLTLPNGVVHSVHPDVLLYIQTLQSLSGTKPVTPAPLVTQFGLVQEKLPPGSLLPKPTSTGAPPVVKKTKSARTA